MVTSKKIYYDNNTYIQVFISGLKREKKRKIFVLGQYAVKVQRSLAPLSWFPGSRKPTAHVHQCCRFQSYAKSRRLHAIANEIYNRNLHCVNHIPGIHDNGPPTDHIVTFDFNSVLGGKYPMPPSPWHHHCLMESFLLLLFIKKNL